MNRWKFTLILLSVASFFIYFLTSAGKTPYNYFTRLAASFLEGKYYLTENPAWLNELIPIGENKFAIVYPPVPALVSIPFIVVFGNKFEQQILSQLMGSLAAFVWGWLAYKLTNKKSISLWMFLLTAFGNIIWFLSATGSVWYVGQVCAFLFLTLTLYESLTKKRLLLIGLYFGLATLSRLQLSLALPLVVCLNWQSLKHIKKLISLFLLLSFFGIMYGTYNYLRFGSFLQTGYSLIPGVVEEPWYKEGIFSFSYIVDNLRVMFLSLPIFKNIFPFITPSWGGLAIWITTPTFIYSLFNNLKEKSVLFSWVSICLISFIIFTHGGTGFTQFGYRYAVDFYPILFFLIIKNLIKNDLKWHHWILLTLSIIVNLWGVIWINKFGWVSF
ncbi:MAG TPA: hypothetical protein VL401_00470 [Alphaproteobacteria bacterium]|jgi:hypothetical protein|nr:hypothetical protein [Alphaproteobacteria bacterium]